jgi:hypothetical protein
MKDYKSQSMQQSIDTAVKVGVALAEARLSFAADLMSYTLQMNLFAKLGFGLAQVTFDVNISLGYPLVICDLHSWRLAIKGATKIR